MGSSVDLIQIDAKKVAVLHRALAEVDKDAARALTKELRKIAKDKAANKVREAALSIPTGASLTDLDAKTERAMKKQGALGLRQGLAAAVDIKIGRPVSGAFVRIRISGSKFAKFTGKYRKIPRYMEGLGRKPWRHPVWPDKGATNGQWDGAWAQQDSHPFLLPTVLPLRPIIAVALRDEYEKVLGARFRNAGL